MGAEMTNLPPSVPRYSDYALSRLHVGSLFAAAVLFLMLGLVPSCDRTRTPTSSDCDAAGAEVKLGFFANLTHAQAVLGMSDGSLATALAPDQVTSRIFNAGPSLIEALFAGEVHIGYIGPGPAINGYVKSRGDGLRVIAGGAANGVGIVARKGAGISSMKDLRGKRIATPQLGNTQDIAARHYLLKELGQETADNVVPVANSEQMALMERGDIDAAWAPEPWAARLVVESGGILIAEEKDLWEGGRFTLALIITTPEFLASRPEVVRKVLAVHKSWTKRLRENPDECAPLLGKALNELTGKSIPAEAFKQALARTQFTNEPLEETLSKFAEWSFELGFSKTKPDLSGMVDTAILRSLPD